MPCWHRTLKHDRIQALYIYIGDKKGYGRFADCADVFGSGDFELTEYRERCPNKQVLDACTSADCTAKVKVVSSWDVCPSLSVFHSLR